MADIVVVGSANTDRTIVVDRLPHAGETVTGGPVAVRPGGKGANQAVAAARLGRSVAFVGRVGRDDDGRAIREGLREEGIDTTWLTETPGPSGTAFICVDADGENTIVVSPGANALVTSADVVAAGEEIARAKVLLVQLEIPLEAARTALELASGIRVLNPAPARQLPVDVLGNIDLIIPNATELAVLTGGTRPSTHGEAAGLASSLGIENVVVTLGSDGALLVRSGDYRHLPALEVHAVDTTGAGDIFCATVADALASGLALDDAAERAVVAAGRATTTRGARVPRAERPMT